MRMLRYCATPCALLTLALLFRTTPTVGSSFDFDHGNAAIEVVIPAAIPAILGTVSPGANDASLVLRITTIISNAWFDAIAPTTARPSACTRSSAGVPPWKAPPIATRTSR